MVVLDTDHVSLLEWETGLATQRLRARLRRIAPDLPVTTVISFEEQARGWLTYLARSRSWSFHS